MSESPRPWIWPNENYASIKCPSSVTLLDTALEGVLPLCFRTMNQVFYYLTMVDRLSQGLEVKFSAFDILINQVYFHLQYFIIVSLHVFLITRY